MIRLQQIVSNPHTVEVLRIDHSKLLCLLIHTLHKPVRIRLHHIRKHIRCRRRRRHNDQIYQLRNRITGSRLHYIVAERIPACNICISFIYLCRTLKFQIPGFYLLICQKNGHQFRHTCRRPLFLCIFLP